VLDGAHFVVVSRPGHRVEDVVSTLPELEARMQPIARGTDRLTVSSDATPLVFPIDAVTPDVSSTDIRARAARGDPLTGMVPEPIAVFIRHHRLYEPSEHGE